MGSASLPHEFVVVHRKMNESEKEELLICFWFTFPEHITAPIGMGVTAFSEKDALRILEESGYEYHKNSKYMVKKNIRFDDLDQKNVVPNMGPMIFRGIWYPCLNIGLGASGQKRTQ